MSGGLLLKNCGGAVSGDLREPTLDIEAIAIDGGRIIALGPESTMPELADGQVVDLNGAIVIPGLIDAHSHPVIGDFTPRQHTVGWAGRALHGGVTTLISAGETHWPGRTKDGPEAKAICAAAYLTSRARQAGVARIQAGALLLDRGISTADIDDLHELGVRMLGEIGLGSEKDTAVIAELVSYAVSLGWVAPLHFGGASVPGSSVVGVEMARAVDPTVISHINGGPTARDSSEIRTLIQESSATIEVVFAGNMTAMRSVVEQLLERDEVERLQYGTDTPSGTGVVPLGMLRLLTESVSSTDLEAEQAICLASGSTAQRYRQSGRGRLEVGAHADLVVIDAPLGGAAKNAFESMRLGNVPAVAMTVVDGQIELVKSAATPPPTRPVSLG